jgi:ribonuclease III
MSQRSLEPVYDALGYRFRNPGLLTEALTHPSREGEDSYERLEFLGDRVLGLVVAERLYEAFPAAEEGRLAPLLNLLVRRETLAKVAKTLGLPEFLTLAPGESASGGRAKPAILADSCEAVIAAIYLDGGLDAAKAFILRSWAPHFAALPARATDPKTALQELLQSRGEALPNYREIGREGPPHDPTFTVEVTSDTGAGATGVGHSKRAAEREAAGALLAKLDGKPASPHG